MFRKVQEIAIREVELKGITNRLLSASATSIDGRLCEIRQFVEKGISDLRVLLNRDAGLAKRELHSHLSEDPDDAGGGTRRVALRGGGNLELVRNWPERASFGTGAFGWLRGPATIRIC